MVELSTQKGEDLDRRGIFKDFAGNHWAIGNAIMTLGRKTMKGQMYQ
ncbi:hypothetical protein MARINOS108_10468 [Marinoscillum sp. 108]|nr:hypothetical protein MARINOS108_10468 [Marinoscillum sp. 108]